MLKSFFTNENYCIENTVDFIFPRNELYRQKLNSFISSNVDCNEVSIINVRFFCNKIASCIYNLCLIPYLIYFYNTLKFYSVIRGKKYDVIHINNGGFPGAHSTYSMVIAAKLARIKRIVYVVNNMATPYNSIPRIVCYPLDRLIVRIVDLFAAGSKAATRELGKVLSIPDRKLKCIPNGINNTNLSLSKKEALLKLSLKSLCEQKFIIGVGALLVKRKGHRYLFEAISSLKKNEDIMVPVLVAGTGELQSELAAYAEQLGIEKQIIFLGFVDDIDIFLSAIDVLVLPSIENEDFPNIILEAMASEKIVVGTSICGIPDQLDEGNCGYLVPPQNSAELAKSLKHVYLNFENKKRLECRAKERFNELYTAEKAIDRYLDVYKSDSAILS